MRLPRDWKTTLSGLLSGVIATSTVILAPDSPIHSFRYGAYLALLAGCGKVWVGLIQKDAGETEARNKLTGEVATVPSHEVPDSKVDASTAEAR